MAAGQKQVLHQHATGVARMLQRVRQVTQGLLPPLTGGASATVVVEEMVPEAHAGDTSQLGAAFFTGGVRGVCRDLRLRHGPTGSAHAQQLTRQEDSYSRKEREARDCRELRQQNLPACWLQTG